MSNLFTQQEYTVLMRILGYWPLAMLVVGLIVGWIIGKLA